MTEDARQFATFAEFYPFYLQEHTHPTCRRLHFIGSTLVLLLASFALFSGKWMLLLWLPVLGYGFAWVGHFVFEKNRPATFKYPWFSFMGDWVMYKDMFTGKVPF